MRCILPLRTSHGWRLDARRRGGVAHGAFGALPGALRSRAAGLGSDGAAGRLAALLLRWSKGSRLGEDAFARHFFGRDPGSHAVHALRAAAAAGIADATSHADLRDASGYRSEDVFVRPARASRG